MGPRLLLVWPLPALILVLRDSLVLVEEGGREGLGGQGAWAVAHYSLVPDVNSGEPQLG